MFHCIRNGCSLGQTWAGSLKDVSTYGEILCKTRDRPQYFPKATIRYLLA